MKLGQGGSPADLNPDGAEDEDDTSLAGILGPLVRSIGEGIGTAIANSLKKVPGMETLGTDNQPQQPIVVQPDK